jgi:seryl-tRNA synthetase
LVILNRIEQWEQTPEEIAMSDQRQRTEELISALKQQRDEIALKIHLAEAEMKQEWGRLDDKLNELSHQFAPVKDAVGETTGDVWESLKLVAEEIKHGFDRIRKSL